MTVYPCNAGDGANGGIGTSSPAIAPASIYIGPGYLIIGLGWSMAMAAVTSSGVQSFGPWFTIVNNPLRPPTIRLAFVGPTDMTLAFDPAPALADLIVTDFICEVSPDNGTTVYTCDGGANGTHGSVGLASPAKLPKSIYYNPGYYEIVAGWSIRMRAVSKVIDSPETAWFQIA